MSDKEWDPMDIFDLFGDELTRRILVLASDQPISADDASSVVDASPPTIYRRFNALLEHDLVKEQQQIDKNGNHYKTFETTLNKVVFEIDDGGYNINLQMRKSLVDQFVDMWFDFGQSSSCESVVDKETPTYPREFPHR
jgi:predicted transcriptional regulator